MQNNIYNFLKHKDLIKRGKPNLERLKNISKSNALDFAQEISDISRNPDMSRENSIYSTFASSSVSGGRDICNNPNCRMERLRSLSKFAVLFSDKVYLNNFFSDIHKFKNVNEDKVKYEFFIDISIMIQIKPLIDNGYFSILTPSNECTCQKCQSVLFKGVFEKDTCNRIKKSSNDLSKKFLDNINVVLNMSDEGKYSYEILSTDDFIEHGRRFFEPYNSQDVPKLLENHPGLLAKLTREKSLVLSSQMKKKMHFHNELAGSVYKNVANQIFASQTIGASFLTSREIELDFLSSITDNKFSDYRNDILMRHLNIILPFLEDISVKNLIKLRSREEESLIEFRVALLKSIEQIKIIDRSFSEKDAKQIYSDIIRPKLSNFDNRIKQAKKDLVSKPLRTTIATFGALAFGFYSGVVPMELLGLAKGLGLTKIVSDLLEKTMGLGDAQKSIRSDNMYFLWKIKQQV